MVARMPCGGLTDWNTDTESPAGRCTPPGAACQRIKASMWLLMSWMVTLWRWLMPRLHAPIRLQRPAGKRNQLFFASKTALTTRPHPRFLPCLTMLR